MQPNSELRIYPLDLARHGKTASGLPLYRVVWADDRKTRAFQGDREFTLPRYAHQQELAGKWVIERWASAFDLTRMTEAQYYEFVQTMNMRQKADTATERLVNQFLETMPKEERNGLLKSFTPPERKPVVEPYPHDGDYEFTGHVFSGHVEEWYVHKLIEMHEFRMHNTTSADRMRESKQAEEAKEKAADEKFDEMFDEAREEALIQ